MKKVITKVCLLLTLTLLLCMACKADVMVKTDDPPSSGSKEPQIKVSISADYPDFTLDYTYDASIYMYTFNLVSSITFDELTWYLNNSKLIGTENQMKINTSAIAKKGIYHMLVTGVNNGIVYSAEIMFEVN